jgi:hypothetical protein
MAKSKNKSRPVGYYGPSVLIRRPLILMVVNRHYFLIPWFTFAFVLSAYIPLSFRVVAMIRQTLNESGAYLLGGKGGKL